MAGQQSILIESIAKLGYKPEFLIQENLLRSHGAYWELARSLESSDPIASKAFRTIGDICSLSINSDNWNLPFWPLLSANGQRTFMPEDLDIEQIEFIKQLVAQVDNQLLKGRCNDLVWFTSPDKKKVYEYAINAVNCWISAGTNSEYWFSEGEANWRRATEFVLRYQLRSEANQIREVLLETSFTSSDPSLISQAVALISLLPLDESTVEQIEPILNRACSLTEDEWQLRGLHEQLHQHLMNQKREEQGWAEVEKIGISWVAEAQNRRSGPSPSEMVTAHFFENALKELKRIPRKFRTANTLELLRNLPLQIRDAAKRSIEEMHEFTSEPIDLSAPKQELISQLSGASAVDALMKFCNFTELPSFEADKKNSLEQSRSSIRDLVSMSIVASDGKKVFNPDPDKLGSFGVPETTWARMMTHHQLRIALTAEMLIVPGLDILRNEHHLLQRDFETIVGASSIWPVEQTRLIALGLFHGYYGDFATAMHLLVPQVESMVRYQLNEAGISTTKIDTDSVETEIGLTSLMAIPEITELFGLDLCYTIRALYCGPSGPNARNNLAHGLLTYEEAQGAVGAYSWWLTLRLSFNNYFNRLRAISPTQ